MRVMSYSPSVEAYARSGNLGKYIDLTPDIVQCTVSRKSDAASEFSMTLQNVNWKYNGVFTPFDPIVIFATKNERRKLFTGYISTCDAFQLYQGDFKLSGLCTIYKLQQTFWDSLIYESQELLMSDAYHNGKQDNGYADLVKRLLIHVAHWPGDSIIIQDSPPKEAMDIAYEMYAANLDSSNQLKSMVNDFYEVLRTHGPVISSNDTSSGSSMGSGTYDINDANMTASQKKVVEVAMNSSSYGIPNVLNECLKWVNDVFDAAGYPFNRYPAAHDVWYNMSQYGGTDVENAPPASVVVGTGTPVDGVIYGHIGIVITGRRVAENVGFVRMNSIDSFYSWQGKLGWVAIPGVEYAKSKGGAYFGIDMDMPEEKFVEKWGTRIDNFSAHYIDSKYARFWEGALHGHGKTIAREARKNGVDPRIVVAIAGAESGYGNLTTSGGTHGIHNYWSWGVKDSPAGIWSPTVDGAIAEFCEKFGAMYAGKSPEECADMQYGEKDYIMAHWQPVIDAI